ncbi:uncharacterized protein C8R40DRAFT_1172305 [Lentinula edodes]|uniref:uncharacterized protein n=1 Tax=Lentinula edodes TaxID=5353 RepID=UPI001E8CA966|nr:uncharacterized protein C8R40DRAFT_1172305 [Lentinula edodes]KAH7873513.1 hypothetical protein C8R40DRAFT_1172305 [Lentinula edodes]
MRSIISFSGYNLTFTVTVLLIIICHLEAIASPLVVREASSAEVSLQLMARADSYSPSQASTEHNHTVGALERFYAGIILLPRRGRRKTTYYKYGVVLGEHAYLKELGNVEYKQLKTAERGNVISAGVHEPMTLRMVDSVTADLFCASSEHSCRWVVETLDLIKKHSDSLEGIDEKWRGLSDEEKTYIRQQITGQEHLLNIPMTC